MFFLLFTLLTNDILRKYLLKKTCLRWAKETSISLEEWMQFLVVSASLSIYPAFILINFYNCLYCLLLPSEHVVEKLVWRKLNRQATFQTKVLHTSRPQPKLKLQEDMDQVCVEGVRPLWSSYEQMEEGGETLLGFCSLRVSFTASADRPASDHSTVLPHTSRRGTKFQVHDQRDQVGVEGVRPLARSYEQMKEGGETDQGPLNRQSLSGKVRSYMFYLNYKNTYVHLTKRIFRWPIKIHANFKIYRPLSDNLLSQDILLRTRMT